MEIEKFLEKTKKSALGRRRLVCKDGFNMSVQDEDFNYCDEYTVEIGTPSEVEPLILCYAEDAKNPTETVYGFVPLDEVEAVIQKHGGLEEVNEDMTDLKAFREFMMSRFMRRV